jgi:diaminohydroxyphosphoribosylaminopyrimidine deaminase/5-amino-6-(5-phosphoribosylamino)uracil reductase
MNENEKYMLRAIQLSKIAGRAVYPNPSVGAVLVHHKTIIGEGYHRQYGSLHAEAMCIESVELRNKNKIEAATLYCTLEPCSHTGQQPPCVDAIIKNNIKKVVIGSLDPNATVAGRGLSILKSKGIEVEAMCLDEICQKNAIGFHTFHTKKRPYIILKWAETQDGFIAIDNKTQTVISNKYTQYINHKWRSETHAIMIGTNTATVDNPHLTNRKWYGGTPIRLLIDMDKKVDDASHIFNNEAPTFRLTNHNNSPKSNELFLEDNSIDSIIEALNSQSIQSVIIEGGTQLINSFLASNTWDEARVIKSIFLQKEGYKAPSFNHPKTYSHSVSDNQINYYHNTNKCT